MDSEQALVLKATNRKNVLIVTCMIAAQLFLFVGTWAYSPGYIEPFAKNPLGAGVLIATVLWQAFGIWFALRPAEPAKAQKKWYLVQSFCIAPSFLVPLLGPATITIIQAFRVDRWPGAPGG